LCPGREVILHLDENKKRKDCGMNSLNVTIQSRDIEQYFLLFCSFFSVVEILGTSSQVCTLNYQGLKITDQKNKEQSSSMTKSFSQYLLFLSFLKYFSFVIDLRLLLNKKCLLEQGSINFLDF